jgi:FkbM family methyltransferase
MFLQNNTAAFSEYGFWYAGNVLDVSDISYGITNNGSVEKEETGIVIKILNHLLKIQNISLYDIGANSGYYGILSAFLYKNKINVYSFEPLLEYIDCIKKSVYLNRLDNLEIFECALGNKETEKTMYLAGSGSSFEKSFNGENIENKREIKIKRLDDLVSKEKITLPDFIKIDVEGYELKVLQGAHDTISKSHPILFIEIVYSMNNLGRSYTNIDFTETFTFLEKMGYEAYKMENGILKSFNPEQKPDGVYMYFFINKNKHPKLINDIFLCKT